MGCGVTKVTLFINAIVGKGTSSIEIDLEMAPGEVVGIIGSNGVGKTTLVETIAGIIPVRSGTIRFGDVMWDSPAEKVWVSPEERHCAVAFQDTRLFPHMTVMQNVMFGLRSRGVTKDNAQLIAKECLEKVGVLHLSVRKSAGLSGGEAQRVALARALAGDPKVLLLDEPLSAIDADSKDQLRSVLSEVLQGFPGVALLVSHEPADVESLATRTVTLG